MKRTNQKEKELIEQLVAGGAAKTIAESVARDLQVMAAKHFKTCQQNSNVGLSKPEEIAQGILESAIKEKATAMPGVQDVEFRYDARGVTVGLHLESGESNSFVGRGWWITPSEEDLATLDEDYLDEYSPLHAKYVSLWDGDNEVVTDCLINTNTGQVWAEASDEVEDLEVLEKESIRLADGTEFEIEEVDGARMVQDVAGLREAASAPYPVSMDRL